MKYVDEDYIKLVNCALKNEQREMSIMLKLSCHILVSTKMKSDVVTKHDSILHFDLNLLF